VTLTVRAPAKVNWTLEVLGKRPDGYHEVRSVMQTIDLCDTITLERADGISLTLAGDAAALAALPVEDNLAFRAAVRLRDRAGGAPGARITIEKRIPASAGLGGGSSDAAATLRGLRALWRLDIAEGELATIAAGLGSDVPFFLRGGTAIASGRGEVVEPLPDAVAPRLTLTAPPPSAATDKTARMYAALRPEHYTDGARSAALAERIRRGGPVRDEDCYNVFELVLPGADARAAGGRPHLCGSGPAYVTLTGTGIATLPAAATSVIAGRDG
jgi:4-diphosphocytidyl-2-C-methyl-D-erythritol kinase